MPWKKDANGTFQLDEKKGLPLWVQPSGESVPIDPQVLFDRITRLENTVKSQKDRMAPMETQLKAAKDAGIDDLTQFIAEAQKALDTLAGLEPGGAPEPGEAARLKNQIRAQAREMERLKKSNAETMEAVFSMMIQGAFEASRFLREKSLLPPEVAFAYLGHLFSVENKEGRLTITARYPDGNPVNSEKDPEGPADFEEALRLILLNHPMKARLLKSPGSGSGSPPGVVGVPGVPVLEGAGLYPSMARS